MRLLLATLALFLGIGEAATSLFVVMQAQAGTEESGVSGYVLAPDGAPVPGGTVIAQSRTRFTTPIDRTGRFRLVTTLSGVHEFLVTAPGLVPYRLLVTVPPSKSLRLPVIRLATGAYFRVRLITPGGEPILNPQFRRLLFDVTGKPILEGLGNTDATGGDGSVTIGPLPRSTMTIAVDSPQFAQTRLPDVGIGEGAKNVDGGTIVVQQPGAVLHVDVVDAGGTPMADHPVRIDDPRPRSPLMFRTVRTNPQGRATFERLAAGRYNVTASAAHRCGNVLLAATRVVSISATGTVDTQLVVDGRATFRITSPLGPARGTLISAAPNGSPPSLQALLPLSSRLPSAGCHGATDAEGRVTLTNFPPGPAHLDVRMANSMYIRQIVVPADGREVAVSIPDGILPVRVVNALTNEPVSGATVTWTGGGGRVEATPTATGDALLEGVGTSGGTLAISARGYQPAEEQITESDRFHPVALVPLPPAAHVRSRVTTTSGEALPNAVVELIATTGAADPRIAVTDASGVVTFSDVTGSGRLIASARGFLPSAMPVPDDPRGEIVFTLARGRRVMVSVELPSTAGPQLVRVTSDGGVSMDDVLDSESDRRLEPPGHLSLGPLAPGGYVIVLDGPGGRRQERIRIVDRDVYTVFR